MKKWLIPLLVLLLLLCGCDGAAQGTTAPASGEANSATDPGLTQPSQTTGSGSLYVPVSALEIQTGGAVKIYSLEDGICDDILPMGEDLLLFDSTEHTVVTRLTGEELTPAVTVQLTDTVQPRTDPVQVGSGGLAYLDESAGAVVFLNGTLRETSRLQMPQDLLGAACLSPDWSTVYYCTENAIRALDLDTGVSRLVKEQQAAWQSVSGVLQNGSVLRCVIELADGTRETRLVSAETGQTLWEGDTLEDFGGTGDGWFLYADRGSVQEYIFGWGEEAPDNLWPAEDPQSVTAVPERNAAVAVIRESGGCRLDHYNLITGKRTASVFLPGVGSVRSICADADGSGIWFLAAYTDTVSEFICRWEPEMSTIEDEADYTQPHYTQDAPDGDGLAACRAVAALLGEKYGVDILIGAEAVQVLPGDYSFAQEYLVQAYEKYLPLLDQVMARFPEGFFRTAAERTDSGAVHIGLVRGIYGDPALGTLPEAGGVQYWADGDAYLVLALGEGTERDFYHEMSHLIETRVLSVCTAYYDWETLNPEGFVYDNDYIANLDRQDHQYLEDADRAFIDMHAMSYAKEDRARIMEYACMPENAHYFLSDTMQKKLQMLCDGIRQAFGLEQQEPLFWEQYLQAETVTE